MSDKWSGDLRLVPVGTVQPGTVHALLRELNLADADREVQAAAIGEWLRGHAPSSLMKHSLRRAGFESLLGE